MIVHSLVIFSLLITNPPCIEGIICGNSCLPLGKEYHTDDEDFNQPSFDDSTNQMMNEEKPPTADSIGVNKIQQEGCEENKFDFDVRRIRLRRALALPGIGATGIGLLVFAFAREKTELNSDSGPICIDGKRCGNTCISIEKQCHKDGTSSVGQLTTAGWIAGSLFTLAGVGLIIAGLIAPARMSRRIKCEFNGCLLQF